MELAHDQARDQGYSILSLVVFEQNRAALKLYESPGYAALDRAQVVPHPLIHYDGYALLMTRPVD